MTGIDAGNAYGRILRRELDDRMAADVTPRVLGLSVVRVTVIR